MNVRLLVPLLTLAVLGGASTSALGQDGSPAEETSLATMLLFALLGGLILNVMPCVLPVLSIKVLGLVNQAEDDAKRIWLHGVAYTVGILVSFAALGALIIAAQTSGKMVGWGFQFQNSGFVATLVAVVFAFGLNLFGLFEVSFRARARSTRWRPSSMASLAPSSMVCSRRSSRPLVRRRFSPPP